MFDNSGTIDASIDHVRLLAEAGLHTAWSSQVFGVDALTLLSVIGREVPGIELGTAVIPTFPRHPLMLAAQALTTQAAIGNRLALGIGLSHKFVVEGMWGMSYDKPIRHIREYLDILLPALAGEGVQAAGETLTGRSGPFAIAGAERPAVLVAALGTQMLKLTGTRGDGTVTWMTGPQTIENHVAPTINKAAADAGRPAPRVVVGLPIVVTDDPDAGRARAAKAYAGYGQLPSYRAMLDREGATSEGDVAIVGDETAVRDQLRHLANIGCTDFVGAPAARGDEYQRTVALLAEVAKG